jgi:hypothetical protein
MKEVGDRETWKGVMRNDLMGRRIGEEKLFICMGQAVSWCSGLMVVGWVAWGKKQ